MTTRFPTQVPSLIAATLALGTLAACGGAPPTLRAQPASLEAKLVRVEQAPIADEIELQGRVVAAQSATVASRATATVALVHVRRGALVARGAVLLELDTAAAAGDLDQARGALAQAEAAAALAARQAERFEALAAQDAASALELDLARADLARARGAVAQAGGAVAAARSMLGDTRLSAPFAGRIGEVLVEVGDLVAPGRPLVVVEATGQRRVAVAVPESLAGSLSLGDELAVTVDGRPDLGRLAGRLAELAPGADPGTFTRQAEIDLPTTELATGLAARVFLGQGGRRAVVIDQAAVLHRGGLDLVVVRGAEGQAVARPVRLGARRGDRVEVLAGLGGGEQIAVGLRAVPAPGTRLEASGSDAAVSAPTSPTPVDTRAEEERR